MKETIDELISKEKFFIELYQSKVHSDIIDSFEHDVEIFSRLNIPVNYHRLTGEKTIKYYLEPYEKTYGTIGYTVKNVKDNK